MKVNVIDPRHHDQQQQKERLRLLAAAEDPSADLSDPGAEAAAAAAEAHALVPSHANRNMKLGKLDLDIDVDGGVYFGSAGDGRDALGEGGNASNRPRRRGPTPIHRAVNAGEGRRAFGSPACVCVCVCTHNGLEVSFFRAG